MVIGLMMVMVVMGAVVADRLCLMLKSKARFPALYARNARSKYASNLTQAISRDKFQPCHWPLLAYVAFLALSAYKAGNRASQRLQADGTISWLPGEFRPLI